MTSWQRHRATLDTALETIRTRSYWSPHPEHPKAYGDGSTGAAAFAALRERGRFEAPGQPGTDAWVGAEVSPYGFPLGITYPHPDPDVLLPAMLAGVPAWRDAGPERRALTCLEILARIADRTPEFAQAVMHTTGQAYVMALQAGGPHAQDRGLEAIAHAYAEQTRLPGHTEWAKEQGRRGTLRMVSDHTPVPVWCLCGDVVRGHLRAHMDGATPRRNHDDQDGCAAVSARHVGAEVAAVHPHAHAIHCECVKQPYRPQRRLEVRRS